MTAMEQESRNSSKGEQNQSSKEVWIIKSKFLTKTSKVDFGVLFCCVCVRRVGFAL